jgi:alginate O-acetyltransferase complex protein AlgI
MSFGAAGTFPFLHGSGIISIISIGGNRVSIPRWYLNLFIVFLISSLWHGANWTFLIWGVLNGFYLVFALLSANVRKRIRTFLRLEELPKLLSLWQMLVTFSLITFSWIFFRAPSIETAFYIIRSSVFEFPQDILSEIFSYCRGKQHLLNLGIPSRETFIGIISIMAMEIIHIVQERGSIRARIAKMSPLVRWSVYYFSLILLYVFGIFDNRQFIYFQF